MIASLILAARILTLQIVIENRVPRAAINTVIRQLRHRYSSELRINLRLRAVKTIPQLHDEYPVSSSTDLLFYAHDAGEALAQYHIRRDTLILVFLPARPHIAGFAEGNCTYRKDRSLALVLADYNDTLVTELIAAHELGHLLGADHVPTGVMAPLIYTADRSHRRFTSYNREQIRQCIR
jgi:hypothetical protein